MMPTTHFDMYESVRALLGRYGLSPDKRFGQNFLADGTVLDALCDAAAVAAGDVVLEVGPGVGTLTERLLERGARVIAVEKDERFRPLLQDLAARYPQAQLQVVFGDALQLRWSEVLSDAPAGVKVVANIPYYITGTLLQQFLRPAAVRVRSVTVLVQREVAEHMVARPGRMNLLGLSVQLVGTPHVVRAVPAAAFIPAPKVDSAVVHVALFDEPLVSAAAERMVFRVARACFSGKRKQIHNTLVSGLGIAPAEAERLLSAAGIERTARPQNLSVQDFVRLAAVYQSQ